MRKEILFAILTGALFGLIIAFGIWRANSALKPPTEKKEAIKTSSENTSEEFAITIAKPYNYQVVTTSPVTISGLTKPNAWVVVSSEEEDYTTKADSNGDFQVEANLVGGVNEIIISAFDKEASTEEKLMIVYSTEFLKQAAQSEEQ